MKINQQRLVLMVIMLGCLAACGGGGSNESSAGLTDVGEPSGSVGNGGGGVDPPVITDLNVLTAAELADYNDMLDHFDQVRVAATAGGPTDFATLPAGGAINYTGYMQLIMGNATVSANVIGDIGLQVNLMTEAITGAADGFIGVARDEFGTNRAAHYEGVIMIANGTVTDNTGADDILGFTIDGRLDNGLNQFDVAGNLTGTLYGADADGLYAIGSNTGIHGDVDVDIDGLDTPGDIAIATVSALKD